jgi:hypothetical protein
MQANSLIVKIWYIFPAIDSVGAIPELPLPNKSGDYDEDYLLTCNFTSWSTAST